MAAFIPAIQAAMQAAQQNNATQQQLTGSNRAIRYQQQQNRNQTQQYERALAQWNAARAALAQHLGFDLPAPTALPGQEPTSQEDQDMKAKAEQMRQEFERLGSGRMGSSVQSNNGSLLNMLRVRAQQEAT